LRGVDEQSTRKRNAIDASWYAVGRVVFLALKPLASAARFVDCPLLICSHSTWKTVSEPLRRPSPRRSAMARNTTQYG